MSGFGARGRAAVSFFQFAFAFGVCHFGQTLKECSIQGFTSSYVLFPQGMCAFCVILGDTIPHVLASILPEDPGAFVKFIISRQFVIIALTLGISYPLSLYRDIEKLSKASALALVRSVLCPARSEVGLEYATLMRFVDY